MLTRSNHSNQIDILNSETDIDSICKKSNEILCLRLYSEDNRGNRIIYTRSGLNQWNAKGRVRNPDEIYIPYPIIDKYRNFNFFPPRNKSFNLKLPNNVIISAKVCQANSKAIMSNPNRLLGSWLLREVLKIPEYTLLTYKMLKDSGIDSVIFTKIDDSNYTIITSKLETYSKIYNFYV